MSRIGNQPVQIPANVTVNVSGMDIKVKGPKGELDVKIPNQVQVKVEDGKAMVASSQDDLQGLIKRLIDNAVFGVNEGWKKNLELSGTGYRAQVVGTNLQLALGFSHPVVVVAPAGISFAVKDAIITVSGIDKTLVGEIAAKIRSFRPADPYKAKGLKYEGERIIRKAGKAAKTGAK